MLIIFNIEEMKRMKPLDYCVFVFCVLNILQITVETSYFKYHMDKGINLE